MSPESWHDAGAYIERLVEAFRADAGDSTDPLDTGDAVIETPGDLMSFVLDDLESRWARVFEGFTPTALSVNHAWPLAGQVLTMRCVAREGSTELAVTNDHTAAYCSADDTIYISQVHAQELWRRGCVQGFGCDQGAAGDFAVAYIVAHEYGHNIAHEVGLGRLRPPASELLADCLAGVWAYEVGIAGLVEEGDIDEAIATAALIGDHAVNDPNHHGTPEERVLAFKQGYEGSCEDYVPGAHPSAEP